MLPINPSHSDGAERAGVDHCSVDPCREYRYNMSDLLVSKIRACYEPSECHFVKWLNISGLVS
jgi:hypothetical protein